MSVPRRVMLLLLTCSALARPALAAWPNDPYTGNVPLCNAIGIQTNPVSCSDGAGGAILVWQDLRGGTYDIYAQRISASGTALWSSNGVAVCTAANSQLLPQIAPDGLGGVVIVWPDFRSGAGYDVYAQRVNASGATLWTANGVAVCTATQDQISPSLAVDSGGETTIAWADFRNGAHYDIYAQRFNSSGVAQWAANGISLCSATGNQANPRMVQAATSSMIVGWEDSRSGTADLYAQRVTGPGTLQWTVDGIAFCSATGSQSQLTAMADGTGGALFAWADARGADFDIYCQRINNSGVQLWTTSGVAVCAATNTQSGVGLASDGSGGLILSWLDYRSAMPQPFVQRLSPAGTALWITDGVALRNLATSGAGNPRIVADGARGAIVAWEDARSTTHSDLYAQRISSTGGVLWPSNGTLVCGALNNQFSVAMAPNGDAGAILAWVDERNGGAADDIYCQRVERYGQIGEPQAVITGVRDVANDQGGRVRVSWSASILDVEPEFGIYDYRLWRQVPASLAQQKGATSDADVAAARGQVWLSAQGYAWELVTNQLASALPEYSLTTTTTSDSVAGSNPYTVFMIEARVVDWQFTDRWYSAPDSGYSVDDLAPVAPAPFTGFYTSGATRMAWNPNTEADLAGYRLYRGSSVSFVPGPANLVAAQPDTGHTDAVGAPYIYKLTAVDVHGNESPVATLVPQGTLGIDPTPTLELAFAGLAPQPMRGQSSVRFTLPRAGAIALRVLDVTGREVVTLADGERTAGEHRVMWDGRDAQGVRLAAGMYFLRLEAAGDVLTRRAILAR